MNRPALATDGKPSSIDYAALKRQIKTLAREHGFPLVGIASAEPFVEAERSIVERIAAGLFSGLRWFTADRARQCCDPRHHAPDARSLIALGVSYRALDPPEPSGDEGPRGRVARYAWGRDYHRELGQRLKAFCAALHRIAPPAARLKTFVDTGRMVDRAVAQRAGLGWYGKNTNLLTHQLGSWVFLAEVLTNLPLPPDAPVRTHCGSCQACMPACPTGAIVAPGVVDNDRCIAFLTIELRGAIPRELRPAIGDWVFGCDICQEVCPVNRKAPAAASAAFSASEGIGPRPALLPLLDISEHQFRTRFGHTAVSRAGRSGLRRNVCVALGNLGDPSAIPALIDALDDADPLVRGHAAWALGRLGGEATRVALLARREWEQDVAVVDEIDQALTTRDMQAD
jgi:epoxyqueuosine reductase